jgi:hypothetical protein
MRSSSVVELEGTVQPDGTLVLDEKLRLPAGRVRVAVEPLRTVEATNLDRFWAMMEGIWADLRAAGHRPRTKEEIDAEINALREEAEEEMRGVERLHEACERAQQAEPGPSGNGLS